MLEFSLGRLFLNINMQHMRYNSFVFGLTFSSTPMEFYYHNGDPRNEPEIEAFQETGVNLSLGLASIRFGYRGKPIDSHEE